MRRALQAKRATAVNLALALGVSVTFAALVEGTARLVERRRPPRAEVADYIWDWDEKMPGGFYVMKTDAAGWPPWEEFNGDGLRDRTRSHEKADLVRRVAVLGDSVTLGAEIRPEEAFPRVLEARLEQQGRPVEVMTIALWGWSTRQERIAWQRIARAYRPDAAVLAVCLNDIPELFNNLSRPPRWLAALHERSALVRLLVNAQGREIDSVERLFSEPDAPRVRQAFERFFEEVRALRREVEQDGAAFAMVVFPFRFQVEKTAPPAVVQQRIAAFCRSEQLRCLDLLPAIAPLGPAAFVDYDHLSPRGAALTAEALLASGILPQAEAALEVLARVRGGTAVAASGTPAGPVPLLSSPDPQVRRAAAWALAQQPGAAAGASAALETALRQDASTAVRAQAAAALASAAGGGRAPVAALLAALRDRSEPVRHAAAQALATLPLAPEDVAPLAALVESPDDYVAAFAAWSLGNIGRPAHDAVPALARALAREKTDAVVAAALARIGPAAADAVPVLVDALRTGSPDRRWRAARTLGRIGPPAAAAVPALEAALGDVESAVRMHAARALGRIGSEARPAAAALQRATGDPDESVRHEARQALDRLH